MRILIIKTSSLGDIIHTLPAVTDAKRYMPDLIIDWVVEESFVEIPEWHGGVQEVIPVAMRKWRKQPWRTWRNGIWQGFKEQLQHHYYDYVIDAQGLLKSAWLAWHALGLRCGLDRQSAREPLASWFYQKKIYVPKQAHAITRTRDLFSKILGYPLPGALPDYGLNRYSMTTLVPARPTLIFLHGTTWPTKLWPEANWHELAKQANHAGYRVRLPWGNAEEKARAQRIVAVNRNASLMPSTNLHGIAAELSTATAVVSVDTGLAHLAAAMGVPGITLYGATQPALTGTFGPDQVHIQASYPCAPCLHKKCLVQRDAPPCYNSLPAEIVWEQLQQLMTRKQQAHSSVSRIG